MMGGERGWVRDIHNVTAVATLSVWSWEGESGNGGRAEGEERE